MYSFRFRLEEFRPYLARLTYFDRRKLLKFHLEVYAYFENHLEDDDSEIAPVYTSPRSSQLEPAYLTSPEFTLI